ncbi:MAG: hypothetical protein V3V02_12150 [Rhizobiaceae bacterium]
MSAITDLAQSFALLAEDLTIAPAPSCDETNRQLWAGPVKDNHNIHQR